MSVLPELPSRCSAPARAWAQLCPRLRQVQLGNQDFGQTESLSPKLMGKGEAAARRELMELHGDAVEIDI
mgnify:CR=1 FL=1